jgi:hypothetical protein
MPERNFNSAGYKYGFGGHEKDDEIKGVGNHLAFGDYGLDTRIGRRWNVDPLAKKFPNYSPYVAFADNPIYYTDPDGREIVDPTGKKVTYSVNKDGSITWSKNATSAIKRIGNAMARSEEGLNQLSSMQSAKHKIYLNIDSKSMPDKWGNTNKTYSWNKTNKTYEVSKAVITIYEARLKDFADKVNAGGEALDEQGEQYAKLAKMNDIDGMIAADAGHEAVHATNPTNIKQSIHNKELRTKYDLEKTPEQVESKILQQLIEKQEKKEEPKK